MSQKRTETPTAVTGFPWCAKAIAPSDSADLQNYDTEPQAMTVRVGTGGTVKYIPLGNTDAQTITETYADGAVIPCLVRRVFSTGTSATGLVGFY